MLKTVYLGKENIASMEDVHRVFADALSFPDYYGGNLDALNDMLGEVSGEVIILLADREILTERIGAKYGVLLTLLTEVADDNPSVRIRSVEDESTEQGETR